MQIVYQNVAGLDVHKKIVVAAVWVLGADQAWQEAHHTFGTMTADLLALSDWLMAQGVEYQPAISASSFAFTSFTFLNIVSISFIFLFISSKSFFAS